jgi:hypothetical protein
MLHLLEARVVLRFLSGTTFTSLDTLWAPHETQLGLNGGVGSGCSFDEISRTNNLLGFANFFPKTTQNVFLVFKSAKSVSKKKCKKGVV